jgi:hypothetical protein
MVKVSYFQNVMPNLYINTSFADELFASIVKVVPRTALKDEAASSLKSFFFTGFTTHYEF